MERFATPYQSIPISWSVSAQINSNISLLALQCPVVYSFTCETWYSCVFLYVYMIYWLFHHWVYYNINNVSKYFNWLVTLIIVLGEFYLP